MHSRFSRFHIAAGKRSRNIQYYILFSSVESAQETMSRFSPADEYIQIIFIEHNLKHSQTLPIRQGMKRLRELSNSFPRSSGNSLRSPETSGAPVNEVSRYSAAESF